MTTISDSFEYIMRNFENLKELDERTVSDICSLILDSRNIFVYGVGRSGIVGRMFAMRLVQMGLHAYFVGETIAPVVTEKDSVILLSGTGETQGALLVAQICKRVNAKIISITSSVDNSIYKASDFKIVLKTKNSSDLAPLGTLFEASCHVLLDTMVALLMSMKGEKEADLRKRHAIWL
ncbi:MAG: SIS domain-containing protein [Thermoplasmatales archaeon]|jgi:6-phospho-3-hexuloisomerase|nr:SIS domain-containing protein [Candidatus Thermoplasmatota archaeon]MCL6002635.1 SIS domain-containing protein [Candidatus Thermoplasmatota archaeon]MDA8055914.1 SIS domain-containing protein [Thermoplasmatales archaeon]